MKKEIYFFVLILLFGIGLRSYFLFTNPLTTSDGLLYAWIGGNLADGYGYTIAEGTSLSDARQWHVPGFPIVLAASYKTLGKGLFQSKIAAFIPGVLSILVVYLLCERLFDMYTGLLASLFFSFHPLFIASSTEVMTESLYMLLFLCFLYILLFKTERQNWSSYFLTGLFAGLCYLTRTIGIITIPLAAIYLLYKNEANIMKKGGAFTGGFLLVSLPWWLFSKLNYGTAFSAEQNTLIQTFEYEFGIFPGKHLGFLTYLFDRHSPFELITGFYDGAFKLVKAALNPEIPSVSEGVLILWIFRIATIIMVVFILLGLQTLLTERKGESVVVLGGVLLFGILGYAWGAHVMPPKNATILRYTLSTSLVILIFLSVGIRRLYREKGLFKIISLISVFLILSQSLLITLSNNNYYQRNIDTRYYLAASGLSRNKGVFASNPQRVKALGFNEGYAISDKNFKELISDARELRIRYIIIDSSSLYNDDQFYLVNYWYRERIPDGFKKISGDLFPVAVYEIN